MPLLKYNTYFFLINYLFIYFWLCQVFVSVRGLSLVAASGVHSSLRCAGLSLSRPLMLRSTGSRRAGSVVVVHGPSCSAACGIFPDQGLNPCPLNWQADSQPLRHQGSPTCIFFFKHLYWSIVALQCCQFLLYNEVNQLYVYIYPHVPSLLHLPPTLPIPPLQVVTKHRADLSVLCGCFPRAIYFTGDGEGEGGTK